MIWLWQQFQDFALGVALLFWAWVVLQVFAYARVAPRPAARIACGLAAYAFSLLAVLWAAHLGDKYQWLP